MQIDNLKLVTPDVRYYESFQEAHKEWDGALQHGAGIRDFDDVESPEGFAAWVDALRRYENEVLDPDFVTCTFKWIVDGDNYVGSIALRHELTPNLLKWGGQIGYGIRPSYRGRKIASWALEQTLQDAKSRGMTKVLATCDEANEASYKTLTRHGGVFEDVRFDDDGRGHRRYWFDLSQLSSVNA